MSALPPTTAAWPDRSIGRFEPFIAADVSAGYVLGGPKAVSAGEQTMNWKPGDYPSMSPYLICSDGDGLIAFVEQAFGGKLRRRFNRPDGSLMHAEVQIDDSVLMIGGGATSARQMAPHIHIYVPNAKEVFDRAVAAGGTVVQEPLRKQDDDDLRGSVQDASGTTWWIASQ
jgi:uncharacterized glyoxalase superfamily protein PhnB